MPKRVVAHKAFDEEQFPHTDRIMFSMSPKSKSFKSLFRFIMALTEISGLPGDRNYGFSGEKGQLPLIAKASVFYCRTLCYDI